MSLKLTPSLFPSQFFVRHLTPSALGLLPFRSLTWHLLRPQVILTGSLETYSVAFKYVNIATQYYYIGLLVACFLFSMGNRPKGSRLKYKFAVWSFAVSALLSRSDPSRFFSCTLGSRLTYH